MSTQAAWLCLAVIALTGVIPPLILPSALVLGPAVGGAMLCGFGSLVMIVLGFVGARAGSWRYTIAGFFGFMIIHEIVSIAMTAAFGAWPHPIVGAPGEYLAMLGLYIALHFIPAAITHTVAAWFQRKPKAGHCISCGYNLTGNTSGRCPECGMPTDALIPR